MEQIFKTKLDPGHDLVLEAGVSKRYTLNFLTIGMKVEFTMLAGQSCKISGMASDLTVDMNDVEPTLAGGGLQLVPTLQ